MKTVYFEMTSVVLAKFINSYTDNTLPTYSDKREKLYKDIRRFFHCFVCTINFYDCFRITLDGKDNDIDRISEFIKMHYMSYALPCKTDEIWIKPDFADDIVEPDSIAYIEKRYDMAYVGDSFISYKEKWKFNNIDKKIEFLICYGKYVEDEDYLIKQNIFKLC